MVFRAEGHGALRRFPTHAFHGGNECFGIPVVSGLKRLGNRECCCHATSGEEIRRCVKALLVLGNEPIIDLVLWRFIVIVDRAFHARNPLVGRQHRQYVAACRNLDAEARRIHAAERSHRVAGTGNIDQDDLAARLVLERIEQPLAYRSVIGGLQRHIFFRHDRCTTSLQRFLEGGDTVLAEGIVFGKRGYRKVRIWLQRQGLRLHVHR